MPHNDSLLRIIGSLRQEDAIIVVEGKRDYIALTKLGIDDRRIVQCAQRREGDVEPMLMYEHRKVIPLFDNDRTGKIRAMRFYRYFNGEVNIDDSYSTRFNRLGLIHIEDLSSIADHQKQ